MISKAHSVIAEGNRQLKAAWQLFDEVCDDVGPGELAMLLRDLKLHATTPAVSINKHFELCVNYYIYYYLLVFYLMFFLFCSPKPNPRTHRCMSLRRCPLRDRSTSINIDAGCVGSRPKHVVDVGHTFGQSTPSRSYRAPCATTQHTMLTPSGGTRGPSATNNSLKNKSKNLKNKRQMMKYTLCCFFTNPYSKLNRCPCSYS